MISAALLFGVPIVDGQVFKVQSFVVLQRFSGAINHPEITSVRLTVFDGEANASITTQLEAWASAHSLEANFARLTRNVAATPGHAHAQDALSQFLQRRSAQTSGRILSAIESGVHFRRLFRRLCLRLESFVLE